MKAKKALKRLTKVQDLLADVIDQFPDSDGLRELLGSAREAVLRAKKTVKSQAPNRVAQKKAQSQTETLGQGNRQKALAPNGEQAPKPTKAPTRRVRRRNLPS